MIYRYVAMRILNLKNYATNFGKIILVVSFLGKEGDKKIILELR